VSACESFAMSIFVYFYQCICLSVHQSIPQSIYRYTHVCLTFYLSIIGLSVYLSVIFLSMDPSVYLCIFPIYIYVCLFICSFLSYTLHTPRGHDEGEKAGRRCSSNVLICVDSNTCHLMYNVMKQRE